MKGDKPKITCWRAFVNGKQIGSGYLSKFQANEAAKRFVQAEENTGIRAVIDIKPSYSPIREHA